MRESLLLWLGNHLPRAHVSDRFRWRIYRWAGFRIAGRCTLYGPVTLRPLGSAGNVSIGAGGFMNTDIRFGAPGRITIGRRVLVGPRVCFETGGHSLVVFPAGGRSSESRPIVVDDDVWIGAGAIIVGGVSIGAGAVVAAGAVVVSDVAPATLVGGVPARKIRSIGR